MLVLTFGVLCQDAGAKVNGHRVKKAWNNDFVQQVKLDTVQNLSNAAVGAATDFVESN